MSAVLSAVFKAVDEMSSVFAKMANSGAGLIEQWEGANSTINSSFSAAEIGVGKLEKAISSASSATDYWTESLGNYDKTMMEALYSTEELVDLGYKTEEALSTAAAGAEEAARMIEKGTQVADEFQQAIAEQEAELERLQKAYVGISISMGENSDEAKALKGEISELSKTLGENQNEWTRLGGSSDEAGLSGENAIQAIEQALVAAGLAKLVSEVAQAVIDMANEFSEAEVIIVRATGATGSALDSMSDSMMKLYAGDDDALGEVAGIIGELNTRLQLEGSELERVTSLFQDYTQATGEDGVGAVQSVTKVMKNWGVEVENIESLLDMLVAAGQMSGASVSALSDAVYQNKALLEPFGLSLSDSIGLLTQMELEGIETTTMITGLRSALTYFSNEGLDAQTALAETVDQIHALGAGSEATGLALDVFGSRAGAQLVDKIISGKLSIDDLSGALTNVDGTLKKTAEAATTLEEKWAKATNNVKGAFSNVLTPAVSGASSALSGFVDGIGTFLQNNEWAVYILTGLGVALGVVAGAFAVYTAAMAIAKVATVVFGETAAVALWPLYAIAAAIGAVVAIGAALINWLGSVDEEWAALTSTSKQHYEAVQDLNAEYEKTVELEGENSAAARELAVELETARAVYEANRMTLEEFVAQNDALLESHQKIMDSYNDSMSAISAEEKSTSALIAKLDQLSTETSLTAVEQNQMIAIVQKLNQQMPELALAYDAQTGALSGSVEAMKAYAQAQAEQQRQDAEFAAYTDSYAERLSLEEQLKKAEEETAAAQANRDSYGGWDWGWWGESKKAQEDLESCIAEEERLRTALGESNQLIADTEAGWEAESKAASEALRNQTDEQRAAAKVAEQNLAKAVTAVESGFMTAGKAALLYGADLNSLTAAVEQNQAYSDTLAEAATAVENGMLSASDATNIYGVSLGDLKDAIASNEMEANVAETISSIGELVEAYNTAYDEAYSSINGQIGLFDNMTTALSDYTTKNQAALDPTNMITALETQAQYLATYEANLARASELGLNVDLAAQLADGSVESAAKLDAIVKGGEDKIGELNAAFEKVELGKDSFSNTVAEMKTSFSTEMDSLITELEGSVGSMDLYDESKTSAVSTIQGYLDGVDTMLPSVTGKMGELINAMNIAIPGSELSLNIPAYADGTLSAQSGWGLVGEQGPELLNFNGGESIIPADETSRLLFAARERPFEYDVPEGLFGNGGTVDHKHTIEINGSGTINVSGSKEEIVEIMLEYARPVFTKMVEEELLTEGGGTDDF